jgi:hypothetical protein
MTTIITCIPADNKGNKLWLKDLKTKQDRTYVKYKSTYNDMPFIETEIYTIGGGEHAVITGDDGTVLYRFHKSWLERLV